MKATPLLVQWHNDGTPVFSAHFEPHGKGRLATAGGDNNVRLWKVESKGEERNITYLSTLSRHNATVNVVRWCPNKQEMLASAGDDGNILLWVPAEHRETASFGEDGLDDKETWRVKHMCRSMGAEIYDLAWSPDGTFILSGSMDNIARIYNASTGACVRQIAEHNHFVQGVAWDPLNEYVATQSSDRSVHIYSLKTKEGQFSLHNKISRMDLPSRRISSSSPAPPDFNGRASFVADNTSHGIGSPIPSAPGTPQSLALPMNPPPTSHSRRSSFGSSPSMRRSVSPSPSLPLPAVMPSVNSPNLQASGLGLRSEGLRSEGLRNERIYAGEETFSSFFRRLTFAPDGSLLFTPAGQYKDMQYQASTKPSDTIINTVYIYTRAGLHKAPVAYLPGHKKPSVAVKCSPIFYTIRQGPAAPPKQITIDTASDGDIPALPEPALASRPTPSNSAMDPPPVTSAPSPSPSMAAASPKPSDLDNTSIPAATAGPPLAFGLPYRVVYAVATSDAIYVYDTQQTKPLVIVSNLHFATFTDLAWSNDGLTLLMTSSDGFCSALSFSPGELGQTYTGPVATKSHPAPSAINTSVSSQQTTPNATPVSSAAPTFPPKKPSDAGFPASPSTFNPARPASPARSMSVSSVASSFIQPGDSNILMHATPTMGSIGGVAAAQSGPVPGNLPLWTPPETPMGAGEGPKSVTGGGHRTHSASSSVSGIGSVYPRRESENEPHPSIEVETKKREVPDDAEDKGSKKRRIAPTTVSTDDS